MPKTKLDPYQRLCRLEAAQRLLLNARDAVTPSIAPKTAQKIRSALKSIQGAINNAASRVRKPERLRMQQEYEAAKER